MFGVVGQASVPGVRGAVAVAHSGTVRWWWGLREGQDKGGAGALTEWGFGISLRSGKEITDLVMMLVVLSRRCGDSW